MKPVLEVLNNKRYGSSGAILVEMAFTIPILALIFIVAVDLGLAVREHQLLQNAAREGARFSSLPQYRISPLNPAASIAAIRQRVVDYCDQEGIVVNPADVSIDQTYVIPLTGGLTARGSLIRVSHTRQMLILGAPLLPSGSVTLTGRAVFRNLY